MVQASHPNWRRRKRPSRATRDKVIAALRELGPSPAVEIACAAGIQSARVYRALDDLRIRGAVELENDKFQLVGEAVSA